ncbi:Vesicle-associated protein 4-2 [Nymphaea thermarum]|nr:Vesicle-associated protein 4-2 [Nymphaea thermarum]
MAGAVETEVEVERNRSCGRRVTFVTILRSFLPIKRRLRLDPSSDLYFPYEPGKQVRSAVKIVNTSRSNVAFKFQTTAPKSCFMRPPSGMLAPRESIIATVFKFVEPPEENAEDPDGKKIRTKDKFKIVSIKVERGGQFSNEMFAEQRSAVAVEQVLKVVFLDPNTPSKVLEKLNKQLIEAETEAPKKSTPTGSDSKILPANNKGHAVDQWKERRKRYLAEHQGELSIAEQQTLSSSVHSESIIALSSQIRLAN